MTDPTRRGIRLRPLADSSPHTATARYSAPGYELSAGPDGRPPSGGLRASIDALTLTFSPQSRVWVGLDAYTNRERWERRPLERVTADASAALMCLEAFDENGIGPSHDGPVRYEYAAEHSLLRIQVADAPAVSTVRFLTCGVAGLDGDGVLTEVWLEGVAA